MKNHIEIIDLKDKFIEQDHAEELALSVLEGLSKRPKSLPSKLFYDDKGSLLFKKIMGLEEYYPTRCENEILENKADNIISQLKVDNINLVELGCGDGSKTLHLLDSLTKSKKT